MLLLSILPNRNRDWYKYFLWGLLKSKQKELAILIDKNMTEKLEQAEEKGTVSKVGNPSLALSVKALHEWKLSKELITQQPDMRLKRAEEKQPANAFCGTAADDSKPKEHDTRTEELTK